MEEKDGKCECSDEFIMKHDSKFWPVYGLPDWTKTLAEEFLGVCTKTSNCGPDCEQCVESLTEKEKTLCVKCVGDATLKNGQCYAKSDITNSLDMCKSVLN